MAKSVKESADKAQTPAGPAERPISKRTGKPLSGAAAKAAQGIPGPGRPKGSPNKIRKEVAELFRDALEDVGDKEFLKKVAKKNPVAFLQGILKLMPTVVKADVSVTGTLAQRIEAAKKRREGK